MRTRRLLLPAFWEILFIIASFIWPRYVLFAYLVFYAGLIVYFAKDFSLSRWIRSFTRGKRFVVPVVVTSVWMGLAHGVYILISRSPLGMYGGGMKDIWTNGLSEILLYALVTMILAPIAEGLFFRQAFTNLEERTWPTALLGVLTCALVHASGFIGIIESAILALPLAFSYVRTKNPYIPLTVHFIYCLYMNLPYVGYVIARMIYS